jgi:hypothetical protein
MLQQRAASSTRRPPAAKQEAAKGHRDHPLRKQTVALLVVAALVELGWFTALALLLYRLLT